MAGTQQMLRLDIESREQVQDEELERLEARAVEPVKKVHAVILSNYAKGAVTNKLCEGVTCSARAAGVPVLVAPKTKDLSKCSGATTICPNLSELSAATNIAAHDTEALLTAAREQMLEYGFEFLTVTMSERGIKYSSLGT